jgi:hypothetical protein
MLRLYPCLAAAALLSVVAAAVVAVGGESKSDIQKALRDNGGVGDWNYDDIGAGFARAAKEKRPLCVVFR